MRTFYGEARNVIKAQTGIPVRTQLCGSMLDNTGQRYVNHREVSPTGSTNKFELGRENFVETKLYIVFNILSDLAPESQQGMGEAMSHVLAKDRQAHHTRGKSGVTDGLKA